MPALLLKDRIEWLKRELPPNPPRFKIHDDLPFAILRYDPDEEWAFRRELRLLSAHLEDNGRKVVLVSLADLLWKAIDTSEGLETLVALERDRGFVAAQEQVNVYLSDDDFSPLPRMICDRLQGLDASKHIAFLVRAASMAPSIYHLSKLLEEMQGRTRVPTILCYPGLLEGLNALRFMGLDDRDALGNYRVKIYG